MNILLISRKIISTGKTCFYIFGTHSFSSLFSEQFDVLVLKDKTSLSYSSVLYISQCSTFRDLFKYSVQARIDSDIHWIDGYPVDNYKWNHYCAIHWRVIYLVDSTIQLVNYWALMLRWIIIYIYWIIE